MSSLFGSTSSAQTVTKYSQLNVQTSTAGVCIPILYGRNRCGTNVLWYNNFQAIPAGAGGKGGKGGSGKNGGTSYNYSTAVVLGICEGPVAGVGKVWVNQTVSDLPTLNLTLYDGTPDQLPAAWIVSNYPDQARSYAYTAYLFSDFYDLGGSANLPAHNFEVAGKFVNSATEVGGLPDVNPGDIIYDLITNAQYGLNMPASVIDDASYNEYKNYCIFQSLVMSPYMNSQEQLTSILQRWAQLTNSFIFWSGTSLKFVPLTSYIVPVFANGTVFTPSNIPVYNLGLEDFLFDSGSDPVTVTRSDPADGYNSVEIDISDRGNDYYTNPVYWRDQSAVDQFGLLQANVISAPEVCDAGVASTMASLIGLRTVYIRNTYQFKLPPTYVLLEPGDIVLLTEPFIGLSQYAVRVLTIEEDDKYDLTITAEEFPQASGQPAIYEPQVSTASPPPDAYSIPGNVNVPMLYEPSSMLTAGAPELWVGLSGGPNWGGAQVWISTDDVNFVYIGDVPGVTPQGQLNTPLPFGPDPDLADVLDINLTVSGAVLFTGVTHVDADALNTLAIIDPPNPFPVTSDGIQLESGVGFWEWSDGTTLDWEGPPTPATSELIAYGSVVGNGAFAYLLSYLRRGAYGTPVTAHPANSNISFINPNTLFKYTLISKFVGVSLYFKFLSYNRFGNEIQDMASVNSFEYIPMGVAYTVVGLVPGSLQAGPTTTIQSTGVAVLALVVEWLQADDPTIGYYTVSWSTDNSSWSSAVVGFNTTGLVNRYPILPVPPDTDFYVRVSATTQNGLGTSGWTEISGINTGPLWPNGPPTPLYLKATVFAPHVMLSWTSSPDPSVTTYEIWRAPGLNAIFNSTSSTREMVGTSSSDRYREGDIWRVPRSFTTVNNATLVFTGNVLNWTDTGVAPSTAYTYWLVAINAQGSSQPGPLGGVSVTSAP